MTNPEPEPELVGSIDAWVLAVERLLIRKGVFTRKELYEVLREVGEELRK